MEISEIKQKLSILEVLAHYGLKPGKGNKLCCPFHTDKTASMQIYPKTNTAYCFSTSCHTHGKSLDVIDFIMHKESLSIAWAITKAKELVGDRPNPQLVKPGTANPIDEPSQDESPVNPVNQLNQSPQLTKIFTYFKNAVPNSRPARDYLKKRGLDPLKIEVGYNTGQFHHGTRKEEDLIQACVKAGLLSPFGVNSHSGSQAYKVFARYCIVFPLRNQAGEIVSFYFRDTLEKSDIKHLYLKNSTGLYPCYPKPGTRKIILTEAIIDAASLLQMDEITQNYSLLSCYGASRFTREHLRALQSLASLEEIIFAFDGDQAGYNAIHGYTKADKTYKEGYAALLSRSLPGVKLTSLTLPQSEDLNSLAQSHEPEIFLHLLETRTAIENSGEIKETPLTFLPSMEILEIKQEPTAKTETITNPNPNNFNTQNPYKLTYTTQAATYHIKGGISKTLDNLKITLEIHNPTLKEQIHTRRFKTDLYDYKAIEKLTEEASQLLQLRKDLLESDLYKLTDLIDHYRENTIHQQTENHLPQQDTAIPLTAHEREQAQALAKSPDLINKLNEILGQTGITGEERNRIFLLCIATSHLQKETLHALIQGSSGSGKTRLLKQISDCIPPHKVTRLTRISDKVLYNYPETYFVNRLLCLEDIDGLSEEAEFAFRELQSNGELNSATSIKLDNGQITSGQKTVKGPIASMSCTTHGEIYEDNMSRCFLVAVDESQEQTQRVITYQNRKASGELDTRKEEAAKKYLQNYIATLEPLAVVNPHASKIQLPKEAHKIRRLNELFQGFIKIIVTLNQYQRKKDNQGRLITEKEDIRTAIEIIFESIVLKVDELDGSMRQFYEDLKNYLRKHYGDSYQQAEFTQREIRHALSISKSQLQRYFNDLAELEYIRQSGGYQNKGYSYKIIYWDNYKALREKIKTNLETQLNTLE